MALSHMLSSYKVLSEQLSECLICGDPLFEDEDGCMHCGWFVDTDLFIADDAGIFSNENEAYVHEYMAAWEAGELFSPVHTPPTALDGDGLSFGANGVPFEWK